MNNTNLKIEFVGLEARDFQAVDDIKFELTKIEELEDRLAPGGGETVLPLRTS